LHSRILVISSAICLFAPALLCQPAADPAPVTQSPNAVPHADKHILGIIPNFRTASLPVPYQPLSTREKFHIASQDSFDRGTVALSAVFAGQSLLSNDNRSFGHGVEGYSKYLGGAYADFVIGNYMTEGVFPAVLHQDPRYFRKGTGNAMARLAYSVGQIFETHRDSGRLDFNYSEIFGNSAAVAISNIYYKDNRTAHDAVSSLAVQVGVDTATNVLKEFWPDFDRRFRPKHTSDADAQSAH
jgi:hypothetical protein